MKVSRQRYAAMYGPTTGDRIRLADTNLIVQIEKDYTTYGEEITFGGGKTIRDGGGQDPLATRADGALDLVITNCVVLDWWGIVKCDIGIRDGVIVKLGKAGSPSVQDHVTPGMVVGASTEVIAGENMIVTAGGIDTHVHFICPQLCHYAIASGLTTLLGGGTGPATGTNATTCSPGAWNIGKMYQAAEAFPVNLGFFGKGNCSTAQPLVEQIEAGACGLKMHEDWGTTPAVIDTCLSVCDQFDVQATIHTDTLNETGFVEDSIRAIKGRTIHTFHTEGAGGGHAPDIIKIAGEANVLPSSTNPTRPFTINTIEEHLDMLMVCHHLNRDVPEDIAFAESRIRPQTIAAEDILHDMGVISMFSSDSQAMGRVGEVIIRTWQTADKMKSQRGVLSQDNRTSEVSQGGQDNQSNDNHRAKRYVAKYTINPAIAHGISHIVGSVEEGKFADLVLWKPQFFGVKPELVLKGGMIAYAQMGDPNASIPTPGPVYPRPMFGAFGRALHETSLLFMSRAGVEGKIPEKLGLQRRVEAVLNCRNIGKKEMRLNDGTPKITVNPDTYEVSVDGAVITCEPACVLPLAQRYFLF